MRTYWVLILAACSNAQNPAPDAQVKPIDSAVASIDMATGSDAALPPLGLLIVNEVAPGEAPDWFEIVNASTSPIELDQFVYVDVAGDFVKAKAFPAMTLAPGAYYAQDVDDPISGFKLGGDEEIWVYRSSDQRMSDGVDWAAGAAPTGMSYARSPTITGMFVAASAQSKGQANP